MISLAVLGMNAADFGSGWSAKFDLINQNRCYLEGVTENEGQALSGCCQAVKSSFSDLFLSTVPWYERLRETWLIV